MSKNILKTLIFTSALACCSSGKESSKQPESNKGKEPTCTVLITDFFAKLKVASSCKDVAECKNVDLAPIALKASACINKQFDVASLSADLTKLNDICNKEKVEFAVPVCISGEMLCETGQCTSVVN